MVRDVREERVAFGTAVRNLRLRQGLSQEALANLANLHRTYIGSVERGERNVSLSNIHALAIALAVDASHLLAAAGAIGRKRKHRRRHQ